jgi:hypothetical protein
MANPSKEHWRVVSWIYRYLCGISKACLKFAKTGEGLDDYVDSYFAPDLDKRSSLSWNTMLQPVVALSTTDAEYMAIAEAFKEYVWLKVSMMTFVKIILTFTYFVTVKVQYILLKIKYSMRGQNTLMSSIIIFMTLLLKVN